MRITTTEVVILSPSSLHLADGLTRGKIDFAFTRHEKNAPGVVFTHLLDEPLMALLPTGHALASKDAITPEDIISMPLIGVPHDKSPALRAVTDAYGSKLGIDLTPGHHVDNLFTAMTLATSTRGIALMPLYARDLLPGTITSKLLAGVAPPAERPDVVLINGHCPGRKGAVRSGAGGRFS